MTPDTGLAATILRIAAASCAIGLAYSGIEYGGPMFSFLWHDLGWSEATTESFILAGSISSLIAAVALWSRRFARLAAILLTIWLAADCAATVYARPANFAVIPFARAAQICVPAAVSILCSRRDPTRLLVIAAASTFTAHGLEALWYEPAFVDYLVIASRSLGGSEFDITTIHGLLITIGSIDLIAAIAILTSGRPRSAAACYMVVWGLITACARLVHSGVDSWVEFAVRIPNAAVPAAALLSFGSRSVPR